MYSMAAVLLPATGVLNHNTHPIIDSSSIPVEQSVDTVTTSFHITIDMKATKYNATVRITCSGHIVRRQPTI